MVVLVELVDSRVVSDLVEKDDVLRTVVVWLDVVRVGVGDLEVDDLSGVEEKAENESE